jgi:hypothetical protein
MAVVWLVCVLLSLPSPVSAPQQLFLNMVHLPLTAIALFFSASDRNIRNISTGKSQPFFKLFFCPVFKQLFQSFFLLGPCVFEQKCQGFDLILGLDKYFFLE